MHRREGALIVSATDLVGFLACGHLTELERAAAAGLIRKPAREDPEVQLLQRRGGLHEQRYIDYLRDRGRTVTDLSGDPEEPYVTRAARTVEAMNAGMDVIYQATVFDGRWVGHPDFLLRVPRTERASSAAGLGVGWHYEVADTKLAHIAKPGALVQMCSYLEQIASVQRVVPERVYVVTGGAQLHELPFRTAEMMSFYRRARARFEEALDEAVAGVPAWPIDRSRSYPDPVDHCSVCRWFADLCRPQWLRDDALPQVAGLSRKQRQILEGHDVLTMRRLSELTRPLELGLKPSQHESLWKMREQARLQVESAGLAVPVYELLPPERDGAGNVVADRGLAALPDPSAGDLFFDIEGDPYADWEGLDYLFGVWDPGDGGDGLWDRGTWQSFWALDRTQEKAAFERLVDLFIERLAASPGMHVYHYAPYEPTALKRLAARHATREDQVDRLLRGGVLVDLYRVVRQGVRVGAERYSIKNLEPLYGYERRVSLRDANSSIVEFESYLDIWRQEGRREQHILDTIEQYNRDDCISAEQLRNWLERRRHDAAAAFGSSLPRPARAAQAAVELLKPKALAVRDLEHRLTAALPPDAELDRDEHADAKAAWLLAQLLDWHNRERKSSWWRFYELMTLSPDELLAEKEPIAGLVYQGVIGTARNGRLIHRYTYPAQEHDVGERSELHDPAKPAFDGSAIGPFELDDEKLTLDIRRAPDWSGAHPLAVVPNNIVYTDAQEAALMRIGRWVADNGIASEEGAYRTARDLLRRRPPRVGQPNDEPLVRGRETGKDAACRLAMSLDRSMLPIQGPPGTGKTYTGARMVIDLVRAGHKVGITSNSHKVIGNLLAAVCDAAREAGHAIRAMQRGDKSEVISHDFVNVRRAPDNSDVRQALQDDEVDVVAGTHWLWAREELEGKLHTLFVDEAGQVSLANVIALSTAAQNVVLLGDPQQLDQPIQGIHPDGAGRSALAHLLGGAEVIDPRRGVFLEETWRMHPAITDYTSSMFYNGQLRARVGLERQRVIGADALAGSGLRWVAVAHDGNTDASEEEADEVERIWRELVGREWSDGDGRLRPITADDIVIVSPFNAHRKLLVDRLPERARVGTVDKFQGQQAPVSIYTMATSRPEDAPRGMAFLYSLNRLNVATSRARALAVVVASPALLAAVPKTPDELRMANALCAFVERAEGRIAA